MIEQTKMLKANITLKHWSFLCLWHIKHDVKEKLMLRAYNRAIGIYTMGCFILWCEFSRKGKKKTQFDFERNVCSCETGRKHWINQCTFLLTKHIYTRSAWNSPVGRNLDYGGQSWLCGFCPMWPHLKGKETDFPKELDYWPEKRKSQSTWLEISKVNTFWAGFKYFHLPSQTITRC